MNARRRIWVAVLALVVLALGPVGAALAQQVKVTSAEPSSAAQGTKSLDVAIGGSGFDSSAAVRFLVTGTPNLGGINVTKVVVVNSRKLIATVDVDADAVVSPFDIEVSLSSDRKGKGTTLFVVNRKAEVVDPCLGAASRGFPALLFMRETSAGGVIYWGMFLTDASGSCERQVGSYPFVRTVSLHFDRASGTGAMVHDADGFGVVAAKLSVGFDAVGAPIAQASAFSTVLLPGDLPVPAGLPAGDWALSSLGSPQISPDGTALLVHGIYRNASMGGFSAGWSCPFSAASATVDRQGCSVVYEWLAGSSPAPELGWSADGQSLFVTQDARSGSGSALYRLRLSDRTFTQLWSRGTLIFGPRASVDALGRERVSVVEWASSGCSKVLVADPATCSGSACTILNGAGHPARTTGWLPDGRATGEGQTPPNRRGKCTAAGNVVTFDARDTSGSVSVLEPQGFYPDGAD